MRKRDVVVLLLICSFVILNAGAMRLGGSMRAKVLMCTTNLSKTGRACSMYVEQYDGRLPLLEYYANTVPSIESTYLLSRNTPSPVSYRHLGCLYGAGYISDGQTLFCPAVPGWRGESSNLATNNGTYLGAVSPITGIFADLTRPVNQGYKATKGYCYWPLSTRIATQADIDNMASGSRTRYVVGLPLNATKADDLNTTKPMVTDNKFHSVKTGDWRVNCLHPDGHVTYQQQPKAAGLNCYGEAGTWGMYSDAENCQFPWDIMNMASPLTIKDPLEKGLNLATGISPTEFAWALQP